MLQTQEARRKREAEERARMQTLKAEEEARLKKEAGEQVREQRTKAEEEATLKRKAETRAARADVRAATADQTLAAVRAENARIAGRAVSAEADAADSRKAREAAQTQIRALQTAAKEKLKAAKSLEQQFGAGIQDVIVQLGGAKLEKAAKGKADSAEDKALSSLKPDQRDKLRAIARLEETLGTDIHQALITLGGAPSKPSAKKQRKN